MSGNGFPRSDTMQATDNEYLGQLTNLGDAVESVDVSASDHTVVMTGCRAITCISGTVIYVDFTDGDGTSQTNVPLPAEIRLIPIRKLTKVYSVGTDATLIRIWR